jgi:hypothetical protein
MVGDKRPREEETLDQNSNQPPASRSSATPQAQSQVQTVPMNGSYAAPNMAVGMAGQMMGGGMGMGMGYDALYIGDLQWVRLSSRLASCANCSKTDLLVDDR